MLKALSDPESRFSVVQLKKLSKNPSKSIHPAPGPLPSVFAEAVAHGHAGLLCDPPSGEEMGLGFAGGRANHWRLGKPVGRCGEFLFLTSTKCGKINEN